MIKQLMRSTVGNALVGWTAGAIIAALMVTVRWRAHKDQNIKEILRRNEGVVLVFWHERLLAMPWLWPSVFPLFALQSPHADGRMMSHAIGCFGVKTVWGSSNRSPLSGLRGLKRVLDNGHSVAITPDGPRGPKYEVQEGVVMLAQLTGLPVVPMSAQIHSKKVLGSWDGFQVPLPFARCDIRMGEPIWVDRKGHEVEREVARRQIQERMMALTTD